MFSGTMDVPEHRLPGSNEKEALDLMELPDEDDDTHACTVQPQFNRMNGTVNNEQGEFVPEYRMFVDNLLSAIP